MSADQHARSAPDNLQFDRAVNTGRSASGAESCGRCDKAITVEYYHRDGQVLCPACKQRMEIEDREAAKRGMSAAGFSSAALFGFAAAIAGATIYWAVGELTGLEIGLVAILIGFMVGGAVRKGASGFGGRRFQFLAAGLTWFAVALAYTPPFVTGMIEAATAADSAAADSARVDSLGVQPGTASDLAAAAAPSTRSQDAAAAADADSAGGVDNATAVPEFPGVSGILLAIIGMVLLIIALPAIAVIGSLPGGIINGLIIAFGLHQAWKMTAAHEVQITGPFKVNLPRNAASA